MALGSDGDVIVFVVGAGIFLGLVGATLSMVLFTIVGVEIGARVESESEKGRECLIEAIVEGADNFNGTGLTLNNAAEEGEA